MTLKEKEIYLRKFLEQHKEAFNEKSRLSTWENKELAEPCPDFPVYD